VLRRIPWAPLLFGVFAAWALLSMLASQQPELSNVDVYVVAGALGGAAMLILNLLARWIARPSTYLGFGCFYTAAAFAFLLPVVGFVSILTGSPVVISGIGPAIFVLIAYSGLGVLGGLWYTRFVRAETERQQAALAAQAAVFAREQLEIARDLQQRLLPAAPLRHQRYVVDARNVPAIYVAGDFYDFVPLANDRLLIVIADVAGKGVSAGLIMATTKAMIPLLAAREEFAAPLLGNLNDQLAARLSKRDFVACAIGLFNAANGDLSIANAGLPDPVIVTISGEHRTVVVPGQRYPLGIRANLSYESVTVRLKEGDRAVFFTDGLPEATVDGELFGYERLHEEIAAAHGDLGQLFEAMKRRSPPTHDDDWTAVALLRL
jgi:hypothetical protein